MTYKKLLMLALVLIWSSGCTTTEYITAKIVPPTKPVKTIVKSHEYACVKAENPDTWKRLQRLIVDKNNYIRELEATIKPYQ